MINKISMFFAAIGIFICLFSLISPDRLPIFGILSAFLAAVIFILNWQNGWNSVLVAVYLVAIVGSLMGSSGYVIFEIWYTITSVAVLPLLCLFLGLSMSTGSLLIRLRENLAYVFCIVSSTINRYVGKLTNLYPADPWQAAICDEVMDVIEDLDGQVFTQMQQTDEQKQTFREGLAEGAIKTTLVRLEECLTKRGGDYMVDNRLTVADLKVFEWVRLLESGMLDHISVDIAKQEAPLLTAHAKKIGEHPKLVAYYEAKE